MTKKKKTTQKTSRCKSSLYCHCTRPPTGEAPEATEATEAAPDAAPAEAVEAAPEVEAEKEPEEMTLDEWKALQVRHPGGRGGRR